MPTTHLTITPTSPTHPLASFRNGFGCTLLEHPTSQVLLTSPNPRQRKLVCGACMGTEQVGTSLAAPLDSLFKQSSLRSLLDLYACDMIYLLISFSGLLISSYTTSARDLLVPFPTRFFLFLAFGCACSVHSPKKEKRKK